MATKKRNRQTLTQERLRQLFYYDPDTGVFTRLVTVNSNKAKAGDIAGCRSGDGRYLEIKVDGVPYGAHRLAWLYATGAWPTGDVDHRNNIGTDNRWSNLREATRCRNMYNARKHIDNRTGFKGVTFNKRARKWIAQISANNRRIYLGRFNDPVSAARAYDAAAIKHHGEFAQINFQRPPASSSTPRPPSPA